MMTDRDFGEKADYKPSVCFIAHNAYGVLARRDTGHAGGVEVQVPLLARWFARQGYSVSMITWDEGYKDRHQIDGVTLFKLCGKSEGIRGLRFFTPRWSSLNAAMRRADADVYYYSCGDLTLGQISFWAHRHNRKLVYSIVNESDCMRSLPGLHSWRERLLYVHGLKNADAVITQTYRQHELLQKEFHIDSTVIPMPSRGFPEIGEARNPEPSSDQLKTVLWVGRFSKEKRLEWLLEAAKALPDFRFDIVGAANEENEYSRSLEDSAARLPNVMMHGRVQHDALKKFYQRASLLCSTSIYEGFPNVYLEAWSAGLPLITTFDPDNIVAGHSLGKIASSVPELIEAIRKSTQPELWQSLSQNARSYFASHHTIESSMPNYRKIIDAQTNNSGLSPDGSIRPIQRNTVK